MEDSRDYRCEDCGAWDSRDTAYCTVCGGIMLQPGEEDRFIIGRLADYEGEEDE